MSVQLLEGSDRVLGGYSEHASEKAKKYLEQLGVEVRLNAMVEDYDGQTVFLKGEHESRFGKPFKN